MHPLGLLLKGKDRRTDLSDDGIKLVDGLLDTIFAFISAYDADGALESQAGGKQALYDPVVEISADTDPILGHEKPVSISLCLELEGQRRLRGEGLKEAELMSVEHGLLPRPGDSKPARCASGSDRDEHRRAEGSQVSQPARGSVARGYVVYH